MIDAPSDASRATPPKAPTQAASRSRPGVPPELLDRPIGASFAVIGAPGTGKTTALVEFVADRVERHGLAPESVLVLASTRQSATRLRDRVALRLGVPSSGPLARTPSSAAFGIVRTGGDRTAAGAGAAPVAGAARASAAPSRAVALLTGAEQDRIVAELVQGGIEDELAGRGAVAWPASLPPEVRRLKEFRTELRELMMRATENGVSPAALARLGVAQGLAEWEGAAAFLAEYQTTLEAYEVAHLDSAELLAEARRIVRDAGLPAGLRLVVVDDFPDLAIGAVNLVREFARQGAAVVAFGDPDTATTGFRGSDVRALGQLSRALGVPTLPPVLLRESHRQRGVLRGLTRRVTERIGAAAAGRQRDTVESGAGAASAAGGGAGAGRVLRIQADTRAGEIATVARLLREQYLLHGTEWSQMAVIVRSGALVPAMARGLGLAEVPTRTLSAVQALRDDYAARHLAEGVALAIGRLELTSSAVSSLVLGPLGGVDAVGLRRLRLALRHEELASGGSRHSDELLEEAVRIPGVLATIDSAPARRVAALGTTLAAVRASHEAGASVEELLWELWQRTGLAKRWGDLAAGTGIVADEANRNLDGAVALFTAARRSVERDPERPAELFLDEFLTAEVPEDTLSPRSRSDAVLVTTPTGAVGVEVDVVVVAGLQESVWPNLRLRGSLLHAQRLTALAEAGELSGAALSGAELSAALSGAASGRASAGPVVDETPPAHADDDGAPAAGLAHAEGAALEEAAAGAAAAAQRAEVLGDELRMFALAVSRSRSLTVLSCVANDDEQPSPFFGFAPDAEPMAQARHPLTLRGLTGYLRRRVAEDGDARAAAALARLAQEGAPGADPAEWYGLLTASTDEPVIDPADVDAVVRVSPSRIEAFEQSPLIWFVDQVAGGSKSLAAGIGTIVHAAMESVSTDPEAEPTVEALARVSEERWKELRFEAPWIEQRERRALETKLDGLADYLRRFENRDGHELVGAEAGFSFRQGRAQVNGSIDRVERDGEGTLLVIDLKTGKYPVRAADMPGHAQMAAYQLALARGTVDGLGAPDADSEPTLRGLAEGPSHRGAALLYVAKGDREARFTLRVQDPLDDEALAEIARRIEAVAEGMAAAEFPGVVAPEERDNQNRYEYRIQLIKAVSE
ncbi:UrvD/REP family ATP-dependent DNA helicase [Herbiconiux flava]|uniref:DNA 3'-5' helicase n=1 Tax=Herbiconiux flava TaxID=881268 RepID=A0A852SSD0_9MICO|nr:UrvD/REP family ATP-dependent DNA helicase [Herbiconiux flava]NYD71816.1 superfamily I DNA/RNA helicase/RecB family exonuclease [Herbiconiux flava]